MKIKPHLILLISILLGVYWIWWLPGPRVANDISLISQTSLKELMSYPQTWSITGTEGLGEYTVFTLWSWPFTFLNGVFANLGFSFSALERILIILPFLLIGTLGVWKLGKYINLSDNAKFISALFYLTNTYILLVIDGGQLTIALSYASFPIAYLAIEKSIQGGYRQKILAGIFVSVVGFFDIRFVYVLFLLSFVRFLYEFLFLNSKDRIWWILDWVRMGVVLALVVIGLNFYWLLLLFKVPLSSSTYTSLTQTSFVSLISLGHAMLMLSPHWFKNVFGQVTDLKFEFILIPILVFLAPVLKPKNRLVGFWLVVTVLAIFTTKGSSEPFSKFYPLLYFNIPGFSLFRDSSKFFFLVALSYTVLIGIAVDEIIKRVSSIKIKTAFVVVLTIYLLFLIRPIFLGLMTGTFSKPPLQNEYSKLANLLEKDKVFSNIFWIPTISPLTNLNLEHPSLEAARLAQKRPFAAGTVGDYEIFNYLREAPYMGQLFDVASIGYIIYPYLDLRRDNFHQDNIRYYYTFLDQLSERNWLSKVDFSIPLLKTKQHQDRFFITPNTWWVIGSDNIYNEATKSAKLALSQNALIFAEEYLGLGARIDELPEAKIVLNKKTDLDLAASFIKPSNLIFPAKNLDFEPNKSGWWKRETSDLIRWRSFLQTKYGIDNQDFDLGGGWAVGENNLELKVKSEKFKKDKVLLVRAMESSRSGRLRFYQDDNLLGQIASKNDNRQTNVRWFEVGRFNSDSQQISIKSEGDINVLNALAVLDQDLWLRLQKKAKEFRDQGRILNFDEKNTEEVSVNVTYKQINPTKYQVLIRNLNKPVVLVFSQNFDLLWKLNNQSSFPIYSLLNGFLIKQDGEYIVEFEPQKFVYPGLMITGLTVIMIVLFLIQRGKRSASKL